VTRKLSVSLCVFHAPLQIIKDTCALVPGNFSERHLETGQSHDIGQARRKKVMLYKNASILQKWRQALSAL
jgi:hypothetical protein